MTIQEGNILVRTRLRRKHLGKEETGGIASDPDSSDDSKVPRDSKVKCQLPNIKTSGERMESVVTGRDRPEAKPRPPEGPRSRTWSPASGTPMQAERHMNQVARIDCWYLTPLTLDTLEPPVLQCLFSRESFGGVEICQSTDEVLKVVVDAIVVPERKGFSRMLLAEPVSKEPE